MNLYLTSLTILLWWVSYP